MVAKGESIVIETVHGVKQEVPACIVGHSRNCTFTTGGPAKLSGQFDDLTGRRVAKRVGRHIDAKLLQPVRRIGQL